MYEIIRKRCDTAVVEALERIGDIEDCFDPKEWEGEVEEQKCLNDCRQPAFDVKSLYACHKNHFGAG
jgi:hypothetical protein